MMTLGTIERQQNTRGSGPEKGPAQRAVIDRNQDKRETGW
jgi:hypothetical protein